MSSVLSEVICPRCGGDAVEHFDCRTYEASYYCRNCGYHTRQGEGEGDTLTLEDVPENLRPFAEWVEVGEELGWIYLGQVLMAPCRYVLVTQFSVIPVNKDRQLVWLGYRIEEIPPDEQPNYPRPDGGYYHYREVEPPEEFMSFSEAWGDGLGPPEEVEEDGCS